MNASSKTLIQIIKQALPAPYLPWVVSALRQDQTVWQYLQHPQNAALAVQVIANKPKDWTPAVLGLLALLPSETAPQQAIQLLQKDFQTNLDKQYRRKALQFFEEALSQKEDFTLDLAQSCLIAFALRERRRLVGSWGGLLLELQQKSSQNKERVVQIDFWTAPLTCLYGMIPEPADLLTALLSETGVAQSARFALALHVLLSYPLPLEEQIDQFSQFAGNTDSLYRTKVLQALKQIRPALAAHVARNLIAGSRHSAAASSAPPIQSPVSAHSDLGDIFSLAGDFLQAGSSFQKASEEARKLQARLTAKAGQAAFEGQHLEEAVSHYQEAASLAAETEDKEEYEAHLALALVDKGELEDARRLVSALIAREPSGVALSQAWIKIQLSSALLALKDGKGEEAALTAMNILENIQQHSVKDVEEAELSRLAVLLWELGLDAKAAAALEMALSLRPQDPDLLLLYSMACSKIGEETQALNSAQLAAVLVPERIDIRRLSASLLEKSGLWQAALEERFAVLAAPEMDGDYTRDKLALAKCAFQADQRDTGLKVCEEILETCEDEAIQAEAHLYLGEGFAALGQAKQAQEHLETATRLVPRFGHAWLASARIYRDSGQSARALDVLRAAVQACSEDSDVHLALGEAYLDDWEGRGHPASTQALQSLKQARRLALIGQTPREKHLQISTRLAQSYFHLGHMQDARQVLEPAYTSAPNYPGLANLYSKVLLTLEDYRSALPVLETVIKSCSTDPQPFIDFAKVLLSLSEKPQEAVDALRHALEINPNLPEAQAYLAEALEKTNKIDEALPAYQAALETHLVQEPSWRARLSTGLGRVALTLSHINLAVAALEEATAAAPRSSSIACHLSEAYEAAGCLDDAVQAGRNALRLGIDNLETLAWFAQQTSRWIDLVKSNSKDPQSAGNVSWEIAAQLRIEALNALVHAVEMAPHRADLRLQLGKLQSQNEDFEAAAKTYKALCSLESASVADLYQAALDLLKLDEANTAASCLERAIHVVYKQGRQPENQAPSYEEVIIALARAHSAAKNYDAALEALQEGLSKSHHCINLHQAKAQLLLEQGKFSDALITLDQALALEPQGKQAYSLRKKAIDILRSEGRLSEALEHAETLIDLYKSPEQSQEELSARILAAELARALLMPEYAYTYLTAEPSLEHGSSGSQDAEQLPSRKTLLVEFFTLKSELAFDLSDHDPAKSAAECLSMAVSLNSGLPKKEKEKLRVRLSVLEARSQARVGSSDTGLNLLLSTIAEEEWSGLVKSESNQAQSGKETLTQVKDNPRPYLFLNNLLALGFASVEYGHWDTALFVFRQAAEYFPHEPLAFYQQARTLVLRAECQHLCTELQAFQNAPGVSAIGRYAKESFEKAILVPLGIVATLSSDSCNPFQVVFQSVAPRLQCWQARGNAIFNPSLQTAKTLEDMLPSASAMDAAAVIAALRYSSRMNPSIEGSASSSASNANLAVTASLAARTHSQNPLILAQLALTLGEQKDLLPDALKAAAQAIQLFRKKPVFLVNSPLHLLEDQTAVYQIILARLAHQSGEPSLAAEAAAGALAAWPKEARWHALAADIAAAANDQSAAVAHLEQAIVLEPAHIEHYLKLGEAYMVQGSYSGQEGSSQAERALQILEQASQMASEHPESSLALARAFLQAGDLLRASQFAEISLALAPAQAQPLLLSSEILLQKRDYQEAYDRFQSVLRMQDDQQQFLQDLQTALLYVRILKGLGRVEQAVSVLDTALIHTKDPLPLLLEKVQILEYSEGSEKAAQALKSLNDRYPDHPQLLLPLAASLEKAGSHEMAIDYAQRALLAASQSDQELSPREQGKLHFLLGRLMHQAGQLDQAVHHLNEAIRYLPDSVDVYLELGITQQLRRQYNQAIKAFEQATRTSPRDPRPYYHTGLLLREEKDYAGAESMLRRAADLAPEDLSIHRQLAAIIALNLVHNRRRRTIEA